jgi:predicted PurR-regulated permease PerM
MQTKSKYLIVGLLAVVAILIAWYLKTIIIYISVAIIISLIAQPLVRLFSLLKIKKFQLPKSVAALLALTSIGLILGFLVSMFIPLLFQEAAIISKINPNEIAIAFKEPLANLNYSLQKFNYGNDGLENYIATKLASFFELQTISYYAQGILSFTGSLIGGTFAVLFMAFFFIKDEHLIYNTILLLTPPRYVESIKGIMSDSKRLLTRYFIGILLDMIFVATLTSISLNILGVKNYILIGVFAGIINVIPYVGPLIGAAFAILIGVTSNLELDFYTQLLPLIYKIGISFILIQLIDAMVFQPFVISNTVKAHPLEIFLVILIAGTLVGIGGMIIAVPVYTILRIIAKEFLNNFKVVQKLTAELERKNKI